MFFASGVWFWRTHVRLDLDPDCSVANVESVLRQPLLKQQLFCSCEAPNYPKKSHHLYWNSINRRYPRVSSGFIDKNKAFATYPRLITLETFAFWNHFRRLASGRQCAFFYRSTSSHKPRGWCLNGPEACSDAPH